MNDAYGAISRPMEQIVSRRRLPFGKALIYPVLLGTAMLSGAALAGPVATGDGSTADNNRLLPNQYPAAFDPLTPNSQLREPYDPFFDVDWSVALRGAYTLDPDGEHYDTLVSPDVSLTHTGTRSAIKFDASAELQRPLGGGDININGLRLSLDTGYKLDPDTKLTAHGDFSIATPAPGTPGLPLTTAIASTTTTSSGEIGLTHKLGKFNVGLTGGITRSMFGPTTNIDASITDNSEQDFWALDTGLRLGFQATPIFEVFGQAGLGRDMFDKPNSVLLVKPDATTTTLQAGIKGTWHEVLEAQVSAGIGLRHFDETALGDVTTNLYDASISYSPDRTTRITAGFTTTVTPPGPTGTGTTKVDYTAKASINRAINSWLALRALASWHTASFEGSTDTESGYTYGVGADYKLNTHTALTTDYLFQHAETTATGPEDSHKVTVGVTFSRD